MIPFGATHTYKAHIRGYPPGHSRSGVPVTIPSRATSPPLPLWELSKEVDPRFSIAVQTIQTTVCLKESYKTQLVEELIVEELDYFIPPFVDLCGEI